MAALAPAPRSVAFIGFMGAGKSAAAAAAAEVLHEPILDSDELLEAELGMPIATFFEQQGEAAFRAREEALVLSLLERGGIIALGGGAIESVAVREALTEQLAVWCQVDEDRAWERVHGTSRPLAADRDGFRRRYEARLPLYEQVARAILPDGGRSVAAAAAPWLRAVAAMEEVRLVWARSSSGEYPAAVGAGATAVLGVAAENGAGLIAGRRWFVIADREALDHHAELLPAVEATLEVDSAEERKSMAEAEVLLRALADRGARRDDGLVAFGGGVVGDLAGFCASVYQRGIPVVQVPTTLVAQVDSAYGGKTGVDLPEAKNYVGAYHMPVAVLADPRALASLPAEELRAGFVEVLKTALLAGGTLWERVRAIEAIDPGALDDVIFACARYKLEVVAADERDAGRRQVLNLGHTIGHAIEVASGYGRYRHGEAVGLGMLASLRLSDAGELRDEVEDLLLRHGLPTSLDPSLEAEAVMEAAALDKKRTAAGLGFVLLERPGEPRTGVFLEADRVRIAVEELRSEPRGA